MSDDIQATIDELNAKESEKDVLIRELQATIARLEAENKWISVKERLPEKGVTVIVEGGIAQYKGDDIGWYSLTGIEWPGRLIAWTVTHWRPLPTPPIETSEGVVNPTTERE